MKRRPCGKCPHFDRVSGWCTVRAEWKSAFTPACDYGLLVMSNAYAREWQRSKRGITPENYMGARAPRATRTLYGKKISAIAGNTTN